MIRPYRVTPGSDWIDYNGHLTEWAYARVFADGIDHALVELGFGPEYRDTERGTFYTVETHLRFLREIPPGVDLLAQTTVVGVDPKRLHFAEVLTPDGHDWEAATFESLLLHVDTDTTRVKPMPDWFLDRAGAERVDAPDWLGRSIRGV